MRTPNYDKFPFVAVPNSSGACVQGWDAIAARLQQAITQRGARKTVLVGECYPGVDEAQVLWELKARLAPSLAVHIAEAMLPPASIDALVAPFLGGNDPVLASCPACTCRNSSTRKS